MGNTFAKSRIKKLIEENGGTHLGVRNGKDTWIKDEVIIQINKGHGRIDWDILEEIALNQLDMSQWELDFWLGQN